jgi:acyl carrier protein
MNREEAKIKSTVKKLLADFLGIDPEDIEEDFSLTEDLHMKATDITDFMDLLNKKNIVTDGVDLTEIETFSDLTEAIIQS